MSRPCTCERQEQCRLCWLYHHDLAYQQLWDAPTESTTLQSSRYRSLPCIYLGDVIDKVGCACPGLWKRHCEIHGTITIGTCQTCKEYEAFG